MRKKSAGNLNDNSRTSRQTAYQRGVQREESPHYVFLYSDDEGDCEREDIPLEPRNKGKAPPRKVEVIKVSLKPEDTLQALAVRYRCTISELKRINNIHKENEIFAHRSIKVPVKPFSIFTEKFIDYEVPTTNRENGISAGPLSQPGTSREEQSINHISVPTVPTTFSRNMDINDIILNSICEPVTKPKDSESTSNLQDTDSEQLLLLDECEHSSNLPDSPIYTLQCSGADWGLSWVHLLGVSLLLGFAGPLIYIFYIAEENPHEKSH